MSLFGRLAGLLTGRPRIGAVAGGIEAGAFGRRLASFTPAAVHVNALIAASGATVTARARYLVRNNGYVTAAVESFAGNAVGAGIKPSSLVTDPAVKAAIQAMWLRWTDESDAEELSDFYGQLRRAARELFITGEVFLRFRPRRLSDGLSVPLQLQMLPSEQLPVTLNQPAPNGNSIRQGIEPKASKLTRRAGASPTGSGATIPVMPPIAPAACRCRLLSAGVRDPAPLRPGRGWTAAWSVAAGTGHRQAVAA